MNIENPILKNSKWLLTFQLAVVAYSIYLVHYAVNSFEFTRMEPLIFSFRDVPLWDFFRWDIGPIEVKFKDYGPILPAIVRWVYPLTGADISLLRWVPGVFFILNTILIVFLWQEERPDWVGALVALLLLSNRYFVYFNTLLAPYSLAFFLTFVTLLLVRKALKADASLGIQALASIFGLLALLNHYTSVLLVVPALAWMFWQKGKDSRILGSISGVAFLSVLIGKGVQIFQIRYQVLRTPEAVGQLDWAHYLGSLLQFFGSFSRQFSLSYALIALLTVGLFAFGNRQGGAGEFIQRLFRGYLVVAILSYLFFNLLGMHEIEARYYLYALPFVYTVLASNLMNSLWLRGVTVALCVLQFVVYQQHRNENYRPQMTATKFFIDNLQA
ncbi:MAG: glycosyltransferase family 39 protein, partial [Bdellovibrionales bacterium]|nr:glycosyltransferase family 39 protein [Bdellovibrionales bacterium]